MTVQGIVGQQGPGGSMMAAAAAGQHGAAMMVQGQGQQVMMQQPGAAVMAQGMMQQHDMMQQQQQPQQAAGRVRGECCRAGSDDVPHERDADDRDCRAGRVRSSGQHCDDGRGATERYHGPRRSPGATTTTATTGRCYATSVHGNGTERWD